MEPPIRISRELLIQTLAYRLQEKPSGGLKNSARRELSRLADEFQSKGSISIRVPAARDMI
jgi:hypothetical protein